MKRDDGQRRNDLFDLGMEEYKRLTSEIADRIKNEYTIMAASLTLSSAAALALGLIDDAHRPLGAATVPLVSILFGTLYFQQESAIAVAAAYVNRILVPWLVRLAHADESSDVPNWEAFRREQLYEAPLSVRAFSVLATFVTVLPGLVVLLGMTLVASFSREGRQYLHGGEYALLATDWVFFLGMALFANWSLRLYERITPQDQAPDKQARPG
jgi:hypothetical protein